MTVDIIAHLFFGVAFAYKNRQTRKFWSINEDPCYSRPIVVSEELKRNVFHATSPAIVWCHPINDAIRVFPFC